MVDWVQQQVEFLRALQGRTIVAWSGVEMAVREVGPDGLPQWHDPAVSFLQLDRVDMLLSGGQVATIATYQNDATWGLCRRDDLPPSKLASGKPGCIFRSRILVELHPGAISDVDVELDVGGDIASVRLSVGKEDVLLQAGEVYEDTDGSLRVVSMDECVLVAVGCRNQTSGCS